MSTYEEIEFGEIAEFRNGLNFKNESRGVGCKIIGVPDFGDRHTPDYESLGEINPDGIVKDDDYLKIGDILFVRSNGNKNLVGRCLYINQSNTPLVYSGFCIRARVNTKAAHPLFYAYFFKSSNFRKLISATAGGANIQNLNQGLLDRALVPFPDLNIQRRIASILSAYDDLIENNLKRIKLLQELAQRTYEEWFVKFRVNGKQLPLDKKTGLPGGWEEVKVGSILQKIKSTTKIKSSEYLLQGKIPIIDQSREFIAGYTDDLTAELNSNDPLIVFGDHTRILKIVNFPFARGADGTQVILSGNERMPQYLFFHSLVAIDLSNYHYARHFKFLKDSMVILPDVVLAQKFNVLVSPLYEQIRLNILQNNLLKESRDILLPKLMSGKIDISHLVEQEEPKSRKKQLTE